MRYPGFFLLIVTICNSVLFAPGCQAKNQLAREIGRVEFQSSGCFHQVYEELRLVQKGAEVIATLKSTERTEQATLSNAQIYAFHLFIKQLKVLKEVNGCTTMSTYKAVVGKELIQKKDGGCSWNGFDELRKALFNK